MSEHHDKVFALFVIEGADRLPFPIAELDLSSEIQVCVRVTTDEDFDVLVASLKETRPQVVLIEARLFQALAPRWLVEFSGHMAEIGVIVLWNQFSDQGADNLFRNNVAGFLCIDSDPNLYRQAIDTVLAGGFWLPRWLTEELLVTLRRENDELRALFFTNGYVTTIAAETLTRREIEIVELVRMALTNKQIGERLNICEDTVKKHLKHIFAKLGIRRRSEISHIRFEFC